LLAKVAKVDTVVAIDGAFTYLANNGENATKPDSKAFSTDQIGPGSWQMEELSTHLVNILMK
jgi:hypothetical protein